MKQKEDMRVLFFQKGGFGSFFLVMRRGKKNMNWKQTMKYRIFIQTKEIQFEYERVKIADIFFQKKTSSLIEGVWKQTDGWTRKRNKAGSWNTVITEHLPTKSEMPQIRLCPQELRVKVTVAFSAQLPL